MSLLGTLLGQQQPQATTLRDDDDFWYSSGSYAGQLGGARTNAGVRVTPELAMRLASVYQCVNLISKMIASLPIVIYRYDAQAGSRTAQPLHPLSFALGYRPNRWQTAFDFKALMQMHLLLRGNAFAEIIPGDRGAVTWLEPIHPDLVEVERIEDGTLRYRVTNWDGKVRLLVQDEVFHIRSPQCPNGIVGLSPIAYAKESIGLGLAAEEHAARTFANGARPGLAIKLKRRLSPEGFARFKSELTQAYSGTHNSGKTLVLEEDADVTPITLKADDIAFVATREFSLEDVARLFDVPPVMLHSVTKSTSWGTGVEAVMNQFVRGTLGPWLEAWQQAIARDLIVAPFLYGAEFDTSRLIKGDSAAQAQFVSTLVGARVITPNEGRAMLQYNPVDWGDDPVLKPGEPTNMAPTDTTPREPADS